jgi:hypothetical protein
VKPARAAGFERDGSCSVAHLAGRWGYTYSGTIVGLGPAASVGSFTQDSNGNFKDSQTQSFNGDVADETINGTVFVNSDRTATATINVLLNGVPERTTYLDVVYVDDERKLRGIFTTLTPGPVPTVITVDGRKINSE